MTNAQHHAAEAAHPQAVTMVAAVLGALQKDGLSLCAVVDVLEAGAARFLVEAGITPANLADVFSGDAENPAGVSCTLLLGGEVATDALPYLKLTPPTLTISQAERTALGVLWSTFAEDEESTLAGAAGVSLAEIQALGRRLNDD